MHMFSWLSSLPPFWRFAWIPNPRVVIRRLSIFKISRCCKHVLSNHATNYGDSNHKCSEKMFYFWKRNMYLHLWIILREQSFVPNLIPCHLNRWITTSLLKYRMKMNSCFFSICSAHNLSVRQADYIDVSTSWYNFCENIHARVGRSCVTWCYERVLNLLPRRWRL